MGFGTLAPPADRGTGDIVRSKFKIGTKTTGVFVGDPVEKHTHWEGHYPASVYKGVCTGENCVLCQQGIPSRYTMQINFLTLSGGVDDKGNNIYSDKGTPVMTIAEGPASLARALKDKAELKGDDFFTNTVVLINRTDKTAFAIDDMFL